MRGRQKGQTKRMSIILSPKGIIGLSIIYIFLKGFTS